MQTFQLLQEPLPDAAPVGTAKREIFSSSGEGKQEEENDVKERGVGNEACQGDPAQLTAASEDCRLHKTALTWPCHLGSSVWQVARNLQMPHQDLSCLICSGL